ncbi:MAG: type II toxin-antitoxin system HicA family toxin [Hyphomonas sp.]
MPPGFYDDVTDLLKQAGYRFERSGKGSHEIWAHPDKLPKVTVPRTLKSRHTANGILKDAGIGKKL